MLSFPNPDHKWAAFSGSYDGVGMIAVQQHDYIGTGYAFQCNAQGFFQTALIILLDIFNEIEKYFSVRITFKMIPFFYQFCFKLRIVLNDPVMDHGQSSAGRQVWMGIPVAGFPMGSPAGVANASIRMKVFSNDTFFKCRNPALFFIYPQVVFKIQ